MIFLLKFIDIVFNILSLAIVARVLISWFWANPTGHIYQIIYDTTEPILGWIRKMTPRTAMFDFSPLIALIGLDLIHQFLIWILLGL
ncbi:MAG: hypothetical protein UT55_C0043G0010 [Candidatus Peregrinibacteria bacterium GW2011_GWE2_39_6]|nr:MAG: hypothetical protein UT36_C0008G0002 [Candidatus Peregrinibacteria bacterium GW2011_GWF2_39_17]KKR25486.1 MAG: hypothetical protein UT55_C0043G0010 [Candidatus Peregrinibacteria bacterium GW2011_GWE2_39_6]HCW32471.1 YggT family protein [Candidatus Peregrinibacteria bacterium]